MALANLQNSKNKAVNGHLSQPKKYQRNSHIKSSQNQKKGIHKYLYITKISKHNIHKNWIKSDLNLISTIEITEYKDTL